MSTERRTWNSPVREPWNPYIHQSLMAVDRHVTLYCQTGDQRHLEMAQLIRQHTDCLKMWIHETEAVNRRQDDC